MSDPRMKRRRTRLWNEDPHCRRCGVVTILPQDLASRYKLANVGDISKKVPKGIHEQMATIEHQRSRLNPLRGTNWEESTTLYCYKCNQEANDEEMRNMPVEVLQQLSQQHQKRVVEHQKAARPLHLSPGPDPRPDTSMEIKL